jgi:uncharacterized protein involved in outer membrane biogenesis
MKLLKIFFFVVMGICSLFALAWVGVTVYRKEIIAEINEQLGEIINGTVTMEDADLAIGATFPNVSLRLENVELHNHLDSINPILKSEKIFLVVHFFSLLSGKVHLRSLRVQNAKVFIYRSAAGQINLNDLKKQRTGEQSASSLQFTDGKVFLKNVQATYHDSLRRKFFDVRFEDVRSD